MPKNKFVVQISADRGFDRKIKNSKKYWTKLEDCSIISNNVY